MSEDSQEISYEVRSCETKRRPISVEDIRIAARIPIWFLLSWLAPQSLWPRIVRQLSGTNERLRHHVQHATELSPIDPLAIESELEAGRIEHSFQYLREYRPGGWRFPYEVEGLANLEQAMGARRGVVLWMAHFVFHGLAVKKVLSALGYEVHHLSRPEHGYSKTGFGISVLNPLRTKAEDSYLASRILINAGRKDAAVLQAFKVLRGGGIVSITCGAWEGRRVAWVPFLGGVYPLAPGAPVLAHATGAALIPVFCCRDAGPRGCMRIVVDRPIPFPRAADQAGVVDSALRECMKRHEPFVSAYPSQWRGWNYLASASTASLGQAEPALQATAD